MPRRSAASLSVVTGPEPIVRLEPPDELSAAEKAMFRDAILSCKPGHFQQSDTHLLSAFARAVCLEKQASERLQIDGYVGADGKVSGWVSVLAQGDQIAALIVEAASFGSAFPLACEPDATGAAHVVLRAFQLGAAS